MRANNLLLIKIIIPSIIFLLLFFRCAHSQDLNKYDSRIFNGFSHPMLTKPDSLYSIERFDEAIDLYQKAIIYFEINHNWKGIVYSNNLIAEIYNNFKYDQKSALAYIKKSYAASNGHLPGDHILMADIYLIHGTIESEYDRKLSLVLLRKALNIYLIKNGDKSRQVAECYFYLGQTLIYKFLAFDSAFIYFKKSLEIDKNYYPENHIKIIRIYYYYSSYYHNINDLYNARIWGERTLNQVIKDSVRFDLYLASCYGLMGNIHRELLDYPVAINYYNKALPKYKIYYASTTEFCRMYLYICENYLINNNPAKALFNIRMAIDTYRGIKIKDNDLLSDILMDKGWYYTSVKNFDSSEYFLKESLKIKKITSNNGKYIAVRQQLLGELYKEKGIYDSALFYYQMALMSIDTGFNNLFYSSNPDINFKKNRAELYNALSGKAGIFMNLYHNRNKNTGNLIMALDIYRLLDELNDQMRNSDLQEESQLILGTFFQKGNENAIECAEELFSITGDEKYFKLGLDFMEKNKYMQLFKALQYAEGKEKFNVPKQFRDYYDGLKSEMAVLNQSIEFENLKPHSDIDKLNILTIQRTHIAEKQKEFIDNINIRYPNYFQLYFDSVSVSGNQIVNYISKSHQLLIEYYFGQENIFAISMDKNHKSFRKIKIDPKFMQNIRDYISLISEQSATDSIQNDFIKFCQNSGILYHKLLKPILEEHIYSKSGSILIIPDGLLAQVPFEAFITEAPVKINSNYSILSYLINDHLVSYAYSANLLMREIQKKIKARKNLLAFSYSGLDILADPANRTENRYELPGTALEIASIKKVVKGNNMFLEDAQATEHNFKINAPDFRILHLGVHGQADFNSSLNSKLLFKHGSDTTEDGNLYVYELYGMDLSGSDLTVLSACETGIGKEFHGEGVFSVARGFAYAGCPSIIMSLWRVNDLQSAKIMAEFYRNLMMGTKTAESLRNSKLKFIRSSEGIHAHPANWAAFVMLGANNYYQNENSVLKIIPYVLFLTLLIVGILNRKRLILIFRRGL